MATFFGLSDFGRLSAQSNSFSAWVDAKARHGADLKLEAALIDVVAAVAALDHQDIVLFRRSEPWPPSRGRSSCRAGRRLVHSDQSFVEAGRRGAFALVIVNDELDLRAEDAALGVDLARPQLESPFEMNAVQRKQARLGCRRADHDLGFARGYLPTALPLSVRPNSITAPTPSATARKQNVLIMLRLLLAQFIDGCVAFIIY